MRDDERGTETVDRQIDAALRSYAEPGEIPEARVVLARVMERAWAEHRRRLGWWIGALGVPAAGLVLGMVLWMGRGARVPEIAWVPQAPGVVTRSEPGGGAGANSGLPSSAFSNRLKSCPDTTTCGDRQRVRGFEAKERLAERMLPKMKVFPMPRPLTAQEQALRAFVNQAPESLRQAVIEDQQNWDKPIVVAEVTVRPLGEGGEQDRKQKQESNPER